MPFPPILFGGNHQAAINLSKIPYPLAKIRLSWRSNNP
jgi:hypothetical protein